MERYSLSTFPHFLFISSLSIQFLYQSFLPGFNLLSWGSGCWNWTSYRFFYQGIFSTAFAMITMMFMIGEPFKSILHLLFSEKGRPDCLQEKA